MGCSNPGALLARLNLHALGLDLLHVLQVSKISFNQSTVTADELQEPDM